METCLIKKTSFSAVIPTKNRKKDVKKNILSILRQNVLPNELLIIDQSQNNCAKEYCKIIKKKIKLKYFHKKNIKSLTEAKNFSVTKTNADIIFFLEDDLILQNNFFKCMIKALVEKKNILGICGILINEKKINLMSKIYNILFMRGIFADKRFFFWNYKKSEKFIYSNKISGGISAWKKKIFKKIKFDKKNKFHFFEDIDFSVRANKIWPNSTGILTSARVIHKWSDTERIKNIESTKLKIIEAYKFHKKNNNGRDIDLYIYFFGQFLNCLLKSIFFFNYLYIEYYFQLLLHLKKIKIYH